MAASVDREEYELDSIIPFKRRKTDPRSDICDELLKFEDELCGELSSLNFVSPVSHVYNPLEYAKETHEDYVRKYCKHGQNVLFLGMNPGPFGMAQNGVSLYVPRITPGIDKDYKMGCPPPRGGLPCERGGVLGV